MMNLVALFLVLSTLATASIWSAQHEIMETTVNKKKGSEDVIVKEGHRLIFVEYEKEMAAKVSISPQELDLIHKLTDQSVGDKLSEPAMAAKEAASVFPNLGQDFSTSVKEKAKEAASVLPNLGQGLSTSTQSPPPAPEPPPPSDTHKTTPKELICDGLGKCKHKLAGVLGKAKDKAQEGAEQAREMAKDMADKVQEGAEQAREKAKDMADRAQEGAEQAREKAQDMADRAQEGAEQAREKAKDMASHLVEERLDKAKGVIDTTKATGEKLAGKVKQAEETAEEVFDRVKTKAHHLKEEGKDNLTDILQRGREVAHDALRYVMSTEKWTGLTGVVRLLGFATAYGTCVWVTFVSSYVLAGALPRQQFGIVQSKIYPVYFKTMAYSIGLSLVGLWLSRRSESVQGYNLLTSLALVLANLLYLEPRATKVMFERMKMEKEEGRGRDDADLVTDTPLPPPQLGVAGTTTTTTDGAASEKCGVRTLREEEEKKEKTQLGLLNQRLKRLNIQSSLLNILTFVALTWHLVDLGKRLHLSC